MPKAAKISDLPLEIIGILHKVSTRAPAKGATLG